MPRRSSPAEWGRLAHLFDEINASFIDYEAQTRFLLACRDRFAPKARSALDLGCATGRHARLLAGEGLRVCGVDLSRRLIRYARKAARDLPNPPRFVCADLAALPLRDGFALVYALNFVMSFLRTNEALLAALGEIRRVLSREGIFVMDYHYYFPPEVGQTLREPWRESCEVRGQELTVIHDPTVDWRTQLCTDRMTYRFMEERRTVRELQSTEVRRIGLPQDLAALLAAAGLEIIAHCERFDLNGEPQETGVFIGRQSRAKPRRPWPDRPGDRRRPAGTRAPTQGHGLRHRKQTWR